MVKYTLPAAIAKNQTLPSHLGMGLPSPFLPNTPRPKELIPGCTIEEEYGQRYTENAIQTRYEQEENRLEIYSDDCAALHPSKYVPHWSKPANC
jgi:hypothetical protein